MSEPRDSPPPDAEAAFEAETPLPPSPPSTMVAEDMSTDDHKANRNHLKRNREVSAEPSTPKPEDVETDPMESRRPPATKRNRLQPIGDAEEPLTQRTSPPRSPPHSPNSLSSSPRHESNLRHMNRGVRKLNVRERDGSTRRRARNSKERDNRSSGSGSPRLDDEDTMPLDADGPGKPAQPSDEGTSSPSSPAPPPPAALQPEGSPKARGLATPPHEGMDVQSPPAHEPDSAETAPVEPDAAPAPADSTAQDEDAEMVHEAAAPLSEPDAPHEPRANEEAPAAAAPMDDEPTGPATEKPPTTIAAKRPRSEEVEDVRPRSPPPPQASVSSTPAKSSFGFSAFSASNPMQLKPSENSLFGDKSSFKSSSSWGSSTTNDKPSGFSAWASPSGTSAFTSPSTLGTSKFTSSFTYKSSTSAPLLFGSPKPPSAAPSEKPRPPPASSRPLQGGGFGAYASAARFGSPMPKNRPGTPEGSASSSRERTKKGADDANGSQETSDDEGAEERNATFGKKLQAEAGGTTTSDEDNEKKLNLNEQEFATGEEDEETVHQVRAKLYERDGMKGWKERGTGLLKLNVSKADGSSARLVMRAEGVHRVILNEPLFMGIGFQMHESMRTLTFGGAPRDGKLSMYTVRISNNKSLNETFEILNSHVPTSRKELLPVAVDKAADVDAATNTATGAEDQV